MAKLLITSLFSHRPGFRVLRLNVVERVAGEPAQPTYAYGDKLLSLLEIVSSLSARGQGAAMPTWRVQYK
eukprot:scaffold786_cov91-Skeletonema_dohrnii-CCMP3373.AAC.7